MKKDQFPVGMMAVLWGLGCISVLARKGLTTGGLFCCVVTLVLVLAGMIDERRREIPLWLNGLLFVLGIAAAGADASVSTYLKSLLAAGPFWLFCLGTSGTWLGGGDVKFLTAAALLLGVERFWKALLWACMLGLLIHPVRMKWFGAGRELALGPYLAAGVFLMML